MRYSPSMIRYILATTVLLIACTSTLVAQDDRVCVLDLEASQDATSIEPTGDDLCEEAAQAIDTQMTRTLDRVAKKAVERDLVKFFKAKPKAFGLFDEFVYTPITVTLIPYCCECGTNDPNCINCVAPDSNGQCPPDKPIRLICNDDCTEID